MAISIGEYSVEVEAILANCIMQDDFTISKCINITPTKRIPHKLILITHDFKIEDRRRKVATLLAQSMNETEIAYELKVEQTRKWYSDYLDLMDYKRNPNYGRTKCFHCLLSPHRDDPIFIGINRLVARGLQKNGN